MKLTELIASCTPREASGARTSKQYDYQKDLSLFVMIARHEKGDDYVFVFDYHDDLLVLNKENDPDRVDFIQIKSKHKSHWTLGALTSAGPGELSILGKLYLNKILFNDFVQSLKFFSNQPFKFKLGAKLDTLDDFEIRCTRLTGQDIATINKQLQNEHGLATDAQFKDILFFERSKLSLEDSGTHCMGALARLFQQINPAHSVNVELAYQKIFNEIRIKTSAVIPVGEAVNWDMIQDKKGITRSEFEEFLKVAGVYKSLETTWEELSVVLTTCGLGFLELKKLKTSWRTVQATILSQTNNLPLTQTITYINQVISSMKSDPAMITMNLVGLMKMVKERCTHLPSTAFNSDFIEALILRQLNND